MLQYVLIVIVTISILSVLLLFCFCYRRRKVIKNELLGVDGKVKIRNPDEIVIETLENRMSDNTHRSLPEIPVTSPTSNNYSCSQWENNETNSGNDVTSELYATVALRTAVCSTNVVSNETITETVSQSLPTTGTNVTSTLNTNDLDIDCYLDSDVNEGSSRTAAGTVTDASEAVNETGTATIATASSTSSTNGQVATVASAAAAAAAPSDHSYNEHFSGDSQDSSKGYTSITVREPLAELRAQARCNRFHHDQNRHDYATVVDDDEVYAAIDEQENISETYAQIDNNNFPRNESQPLDNHARIMNDCSSSSSSSLSIAADYQKIDRYHHLHSNQTATTSSTTTTTTTTNATSTVTTTTTTTTTGSYSNTEQSQILSSFEQPPEPPPLPPPPLPHLFSQSTSSSILPLRSHLLPSASIATTTTTPLQSINHNSVPDSTNRITINIATGTVSSGRDSPDTSSIASNSLTTCDDMYAKVLKKNSK